MKYHYREQARARSHLLSVRNHYPEWTITRSLNDTFMEIIHAWQDRLQS